MKENLLMKLPPNFEIRIIGFGRIARTCANMPACRINGKMPDGAISKTSFTRPLINLALKSD